MRSQPGSADTRIRRTRTRRQRDSNATRRMRTRMRRAPGIVNTSTGMPMRNSFHLCLLILTNRNLQISVLSTTSNIKMTKETSKRQRISKEILKN